MVQIEVKFGLRGTRCGPHFIYDELNHMFTIPSLKITALCTLTLCHHVGRAMRDGISISH